MGRRYAERTRVPISRSRAQVEDLLARYGASEFACGWNGSHETIGFAVGNTLCRVSLPRSDDPQEQRRRWRALLLVIKAKLEAVESDISTFEREFLAWVVDPKSGHTLGDVIVPQLENLNRQGLTPKLLPMLEDAQ